MYIICIDKEDPFERNTWSHNAPVGLYMYIYMYLYMCT